MVQQVRAFATKPNRLSSVPRTHVGKALTPAIALNLYTCAEVRTHTNTHKVFFQL